MPRPPVRLFVVAVAAALAVIALLALARPAAAGTWRRPVAGEVVGAFHYSARRPFAAGWRRGIDIAARPGAVVQAACGGRVSFAGPLPGEGAGRGVSVRCGALTATHLGLAGLAVRRGAMVAAGAPVGTLGPTGLLRLGARVTARRFGYVDPLRLLGREPGDPPVATPRRPSARGPRPVPAPAHVPALGPAPEPHAAPATAPRPIPTQPPALGPALRRQAVPAAPATAPGSAPPPLVGIARRPLDTPTDPFAAPAGAPKPLLAPAPGRGVPPVAWAGLVLLAAGLPLGGILHRRTRRRRRRQVAAVAEARR
jgi:Peptidase family M23